MISIVQSVLQEYYEEKKPEMIRQTDQPSAARFLPDAEVMLFVLRHNSMTLIVNGSSAG
jgi:hypothetical protein